jgi:hypothetical protein
MWKLAKDRKIAAKRSLCFAASDWEFCEREILWLEWRGRHIDNRARAAPKRNVGRHIKSQENRAAISSTTAVLHFTEIRSIGKISVKMRTGAGAARIQQQFDIRVLHHRIFALADFDRIDGARASATASTRAARSIAGRHEVYSGDSEGQHERADDVIYRYSLHNNHF